MPYIDKYHHTLQPNHTHMATTSPININNYINIYTNKAGLHHENRLNHLNNSNNSINNSNSNLPPKKTFSYVKYSNSSIDNKGISNNAYRNSSFNNGNSLERAKFNSL